MVPHPDNRSGTGSRFAAAALLVPPLCWGLPLLISAGAPAAAAAILTNPWMIGVTGAVLALVVWRIAARHTRPATTDARRHDQAARRPTQSTPRLTPHPGGRPYLHPNEPRCKEF